MFVSDDQVDSFLIDYDEFRVDALDEHHIVIDTWKTSGLSLGLSIILMDEDKTKFYIDRDILCIEYFGSRKFLRFVVNGLPAKHSPTNEMTPIYPGIESY